MGANYSHLNTWAVSTIVSATEKDLEHALETFEASYRSKLPVVIPDPVEVESDGPVVKEPPPPVKYIISETAFLQLLQDEGFSDSDVDILLNFFHLIDTRGFREIDLRDAFIKFSVLVARSVYDGFDQSMRLTARDGSQIIDKHQLLHIFKLMNATFQHFGDKHLHMDQVQDLADSLYTSIGRIDGTIFYPHYIEYLVSHPIVEMFLSVQFQGGMKEKLLSDEEIDARIDQK